MIRIVENEYPETKVKSPSGTSVYERDLSGGKVAVIGDVHGTAKFLDGYNDILKRDDIGKIVVLGDHFDPYDPDLKFDTMVGRYLEFVGCMEKDRRIVSILGNHDLARYVIKSDMTNRSEYEYDRVMKIRELVGENLNNSRLAFQYGNWLFSHAGVSATWMRKVSSTGGFSFETLLKTGWTQEELSDLVRYDEYDYSGWGDSPYQGPTWIRPSSLVKDPYGDFNQAVGHTMMLYPEMSEHFEKETGIKVSERDGFHRTVMSNGRELVFADNDGKKEYLVIDVGE